MLGKIKAWIALGAGLIAGIAVIFAQRSENKRLKQKAEIAEAQVETTQKATEAIVEGKKREDSIRDNPDINPDHFS